MPALDVLDCASEGDCLSGDALQGSIDRLLAIAEGLDAQKQATTDTDAVKALGRVQDALRSAAASLIASQIDLIAGEAKITADHIDAAVKYAEDVINSTKAWKQRVEKIGFLLDFLAVVSTGSGVKMVEAAIALKAKLGKV